MAKNPLGVEMPAGLDPFDPQGDMVELANSLGGITIIPVPNVTGRTTLLAGLGWTPTPDRPLWVYRADAVKSENLEMTVDGTTWVTYGPAVRTPFIRVGGGSTTMTGSTGTGSLTIPDVPADYTGFPWVFMICSHTGQGVGFSAKSTSRNTIEYRYFNGAASTNTTFTFIACWWS